EHVKKRAAMAVAVSVSHRRGGQLQAYAAAIELLGEISRGDRDQACRGPARERRAEPGAALVIGVEPRRGLVGRQGLDGERARQAYDRGVEAIPGCERRSAGHIVIGRVDIVRSLARDEERPALQPRRLGSAPQLLDQRGRPNMLVNVNAHVTAPLISGRSLVPYRTSVRAGLGLLKRFTYTVQ